MAAGDIAFVNADAAGGGNGSTWAQAFSDLQLALDIVGANDSIWVAQGVYHPGNDREDHFTLIDSVVLLGGFSGDESLHTQRNPAQNITMLSGNIGDSLQSGDNSYHVIYVGHGSAISSMTVLDGFYISGGNATGDFTAGWGGGLFVGSGSPIIRHCTFGYNSAMDGGAIHADSDSILFQNVTIRENHALQGGGGVNLNGNVGTRFIDCTFANNTSQTYGGAVAMDLANATFTGCEFIFNTAIDDKGGAISNYTFSHPVLINCSLFGNRSIQGGSIWSGGAYVTIINSVLWGNEPDEIYGGFEVSVAFSDVQGGAPGESNIAVDPVFEDPSLGDLQLALISPCIDAGVDLFVREGDTLVHLTPDEYSGLAPDMGANESPYTSSRVEGEGKPSSVFSLHQNYPNPFNPVTTIRYVIPIEAQGGLIIYDLLGNEVMNLSKSPLLPGSHEVQWDGRDNDGKPVTAGVYFARLQAGDFSQTIKLTCLQ